MTQAERYSDKRVSEAFTCYVLFSEPLAAQMDEVMAAAAEDYPELAWDLCFTSVDDLNTDRVGLHVDLGVSPSDATLARGMTTLLTNPGRCDIDWEDVLQYSSLVTPDGQDRVARHRSCLSISVGSVPGNTSIAARFDAARRMTCLAAVFAKLPICLGVYFPNAGILVRPEIWAKAADTAIKGEMPHFAWINYIISPVGDSPDRIVACTGETIGLAAFNGHEILIPAAELSGEDVIHWLNCTCQMLIESDHRFGDGNTLGVEGGDKDFRIRHVAEGAHGAQTDRWILIHKTAKIDEMKLFGARKLRPPPPGVDNTIRGNWGALKDGLYSLLAGGGLRER